MASVSSLRVCLIRIYVIAYRTHLHNPGEASVLKTLNLISSVVTEVIVALSCIRSFSQGAGIRLWTDFQELFLKMT